MSELFHMLGFRSQWNLDSLINDGAGDGVIILPRYMDKDEVSSLPLNIRQRSIFDPQYYLPSSSREKLLTYDFFPQVIANGFRTTEWTEGMAYQSAIGCLKYQLDNDFRYLVAPTRHRSGMPTDFIDSQLDYFVIPFLKAYAELGMPKPLLLQLILTDQMLKDKSYTTEILNWVTGLEHITGVYLIYDFHRTRKQIDDIDFLFAVDLFIRALKNAGLTVVVGYSNTESIPLLCAEPDILTMGSYENLRMFSLLPVEEKQDDKVMRGPNARIYISRLLQWVEYQYLGAITKVVGDINTFVDDNTYRVTMFEPTYRWHFSKPDPYKHYFIAFSEQFRRIAASSGPERVELIKAEVSLARDEFAMLENKGVILDVDSSGNHLASWMTFLNLR